jgi:DNA-binding XRE family transcriptional regulator
VLNTASSGTLINLAAGDLSRRQKVFQRMSDPMPRERRALAQTVKELRARRGMTQEDVAHAAGVSRGYLGELEQGRRRASFEGVVRIAHALDIDLRELVELFQARLREGR